MLDTESKNIFKRIMIKKKKTKIKNQHKKEISEFDSCYPDLVKNEFIFKFIN